MNTTRKIKPCPFCVLDFVCCPQLLLLCKYNQHLLDRLEPGYTRELGSKSKPWYLSNLPKFLCLIWLKELSSYTFAPNMLGNLCTVVHFVTLKRRESTNHCKPKTADRRSRNPSCSYNCGVLYKFAPPSADQT